MGQVIPSLGERAPFLVIGVVCWLCGAVVVGIAVELVLVWVEAAIAVAVTSLLVLSVFWSISASMPPGMGRRREN